jgi:murein L,D-transpeptidase YafK
MFRMPRSLPATCVSALGIAQAAAVCVFVFAGLALAESHQSPPPEHNHLRVAIHCAKRVLQVWHRTELIREYPIEVGKGGLAKKRNGDHRTPIGDYEISWMASRRSDIGHKIIEGKSWCRGNKFVYADKGPALEKLWSDAYGGSEATVISINYPNDKETRKGFTGECIHIHAVKRPRDGMLVKSYGCIHMFAPDAMELYELVSVGTPVKILP